MSVDMMEMSRFREDSMGVGWCVIRWAEGEGEMEKTKAAPDLDADSGERRNVWQRDSLLTLYSSRMDRSCLLSWKD